MKEAVDRRAARTRKALHQALLALILRKRYDDITVQDIIDEADVGRSTFYAHYAGKEDLLRKGFSMLREILTEARAAGTPISFSRAMFDHAGEFRNVYRAMLGSRGSIIALMEIRRIISDMAAEEFGRKAPGDALTREARVEFVAGAFITMLSWWLERKPKLTPEKVDAMFRAFIVRGVGAA
ncbi:MAG: TetR/AcrR family transcriptional regulator [Pseudomonadota bacterium]|nr:TetR/AcrR family transcriptional regulator [Pseudomonadota bacterium]